MGRFMAVCALALALSMCGDTDENKVAMPADAGAGRGGSAGAGAAGGSLQGGTAGEPSAGGEAGTPSAGSAGQAATGGEAGAGLGGTGGQGGSSGAGTSGAGGLSGAAGDGAAGGDGCEPLPTCMGEPECETGWDASCGPGNSPFCCNATNGTYKTCQYSGGGTLRNELVFIDSCTGHSFGTSPCSGCVNLGDPECDDWIPDCSTKTYCSDFAIGYRKSCEETDQFSTVLVVECVCDPDA